VEFHCRLASNTGEIVEGVYAADSEARLRHELEEKGLFVLSLKPKGLVAGLPFRLPGRSSIPTREFLVFNQELATLLRAGMPLVQSLDLLKSRVTTPVFRTVLDDVHERVRGGTALSDAFAAHGSLFPSVYTASLVAGERSGNLDAVLRRFVEYTKVIATVSGRRSRRWSTLRSSSRWHWCSSRSSC
jgi:type IV pilus assembly protein PilC